MSRNSFEMPGEDWTEDEIMSYGLAGEDEYIGITGDVNINIEEGVIMPTSTNIVSIHDVTKSGRVSLTL